MKCYPFLNGFSAKELDLLEFVRKFFPNAKKNTQLIKPYELDICIPELKLALEFNGNYWHSDAPALYHLKKTQLCNEKGYRLIHIWENEWDDNKAEICSKLEKILTNNEQLNFTDNEVVLDFSWFNNVTIPGYILLKSEPPKIIERARILC